MRVFLGTGGFAYEDWVGLLYPSPRRQDWLRYYAERMNALEVNATFYALPGERTFLGLLKKSEGRLHFALKLHRSMTHDRNAPPEAYERLKGAVRPLREAGLLGPFLAQFPQSFHRTPENRRYLLELAGRFEGERLAVEFRHASWHREEVYRAFRERGLIFVCPDYPRLPGLPPFRFVATSSTAYLRLSGRNAKAWHEATSAAERHDYRYSEEELRVFAEALKAHAEDLEEAWVIFNNTTKGHALFNLETFRALLALGPGGGQGG
ncbi:DUF72 domain-containing protein [Thermus filiformis]|uniref:Histidine kinase n=1 Tax=Thermus filiformis TaxID=276 RepID=A0A0A2X9E1_THEFI|nr:DUF72 domain-containing protein [Thermus filiformis]KGQ21814.1 hypothetical protein THFILI_10905 [Thermus filiformis]